MTAIVAVESNMLSVPVTEKTTLKEIRSIVEQFVEINKNTVFDYRDKSGNKAARSHVAMLRKAKAPINDTHKRMTEEAKRFKDAVDKDRRELLNMVEDMINVHAEPLQVVADEEKAEAKRKAIEQEIVDCWDLAHEMNDIEDQKRELARQKEEQDRIASEQEAENQRLRIEQEKKEAAEKAAEEARLAEQARTARTIKDVEEKAAREKAEAEERARKAEQEAVEREQRIKAEAEAKIKAEQDRIERERLAVEEKAKAEAESKRLLEEKAKADAENIRRIHDIIRYAMEDVGIDAQRADAFIDMIRDGDFPVSIDYQWQDTSFPM